VEKLPRRTEIINAFKALGEYLGKEVYATMPIEAGGLNSTFPLAVGAKMGIPIVDADGMGRAFPELQMTTFHVFGISITPMAISDEKGNTIFVDSINNEYGEWFARGVTRLMGGYSWISCYAMTGKELKKAAIKNTLSKAMEIGEILLSDLPPESKLEEICKFTKGAMQKGKLIKSKE